MRPRRLLCALLLCAPAAAGELEPAPAGIDARELARRAEDSLREEYAYHRAVAARSFHRAITDLGGATPA